MASVNWCIASQPRNLAASGMVHTRIPSPEKLVFGESRVILPPASITEPMEITCTCIHSIHSMYSTCIPYPMYLLCATSGDHDQKNVLWLDIRIRECMYVCTSYISVCCFDSLTEVGCVCSIVHTHKYMGSGLQYSRRARAGYIGRYFLGS